MSKILSDALSKDILERRKAFSNYNMVRMREALRYFTDKKLEIFLKIPFYLHINSPDYPGFVPAKNKPYGIWNFEQSGFYREAITKKFFPKSIVETIQKENPAILGLYHIGSLGTFTQSIGSDFDYWVMIDKKNFSRNRYDALISKLDAIVQHCRQDFDQKVSFFVMDRKEIRSNKYMTFLGKETLTVPKIFLKEEFYRTFLMVAGKIPLWAVLPFEVPVDNSLKSQTDINRILSQNDDLMDLGMIHTIPETDILKGILWHICKSKADPVKSLIKATMVFSYGGKSNGAGLLCNRVKEGFATAGIDDYGVDPYKVVFDRILAFHENEDPEGLHLIKNAIFYRLCGYPRIKMPEANSPKRVLLDRYIRLWKLNKSQISKLLSYRDWSESEKLLLERAIIQRLAEMVNQVKQKIGPVDHLIGNDEIRNWTILKNKTKERLRNVPGKIEACSTYLKQLSIERLIISDSLKRFSVAMSVQDGDNLKKIYSHQELAGLLGWVIENHLYKRQKVKIELKTPFKLYELSENQIGLDDVYMKFAPLNPLSDDCFEHAATWNRMVVFTIFDWKKLLKAQLLVSNSWGELFYESVDLHEVESRSAKCDEIVRRMKQYDHPELRYSICQYTRMYNPDIVYQIKKAYTTQVTIGERHSTQKKKPYLDRL